TTYQPDVILLHDHLPDMTGINFFTQLQQQYPHLLCPIVMITDAGTQEIIVEALKLGITDYLSKDSITQDTLPIIVKSAIAKYNQQQHTSGIFNQTFQFVGLLTPDGILLEANDTALAFAGTTIDKIVNQPFWDAPWWSYSDELMQQLKGWIQRAAQGEFIREEPIVRGGDGSLITIDFSLKPLLDEDGEIVLLIPEGRDISERIQMEAELNQKYDELDKFFSVSADMLCIASQEGYFVRVNRAFERILGYTPEELEGHPFLDLIHPEDIKPTQDALAVLDAQNPIGSFINRYRTKAGNYRYIEWRSQPAGKYIYAAASDITDRINAEKNLQRVIRDLRQTNEEIQQFAHIVSHDLRSPLINLKGFIAIIEKTRNDLLTLADAIMPYLDEAQTQLWHGATGTRYDTAINFINTSVDKMDDYTSAILKLARIGRREFTQESINANKVVQIILDTLATQIEEQNIYIQVDDLPTIVTDPLAIDQIFSNLITNAVKYLVPERTGRILISADIEPHQIIFDIQDNGRGIAETDHNKVFAPFRRIGQHTVEGEGMGLAYVQALVRGLGGEIWFESTLDKGTTFSFSILRLDNTHE
ncbi:MAG: PAS domain S-box protein, partial [Chloroflexota bacterium]